MLVEINVNLPSSSSSYRQLPPQLVQFGTDEIMLVELQGALEVEGNQDGQLVGKLRVDASSKKPTLMIGHHLLEGKLVNLPKPLAVLQRKDAASLNEAEGDSAMDVDEESERTTKARAPSWDIVAVVKRKMVFAKRPMPVVGKSSGTAPLSRVGSKV